MTDSINDLELSVRAGNVLRRMKPDMNFDEFMALERGTILRQPNAGVRTWREIAEVQHGLRQAQMEASQPAPWSKRDEIALAVLPTIVTVCVNDTRDGYLSTADMFARKALDVADAFLVARETKEDDR